MASKKTWVLVQTYNGWLDDTTPLNLDEGTEIDGEIGEFLAKNRPEFVEEVKEKKTPISKGPSDTTEKSPEDVVEK
jgi:hypothetical protein